MPAQATFQFVEVATDVGIDGYTMQPGKGGSILAVDFDNDDDIDLFAPTADGIPNRLYRNDGGTFVEMAASVGLASLNAARAALWFDYNSDHLLDLIVGGDCLTGHNPETGKELWRWGTWNPSRIGHWRLVPSPAAGGGVILACAPKGSPVFAVKAGAHGEGELAWKSAGRTDAVTSDVCTPLFYGGNFYVVYGEARDKMISCIAPDTVKVHWSTHLEGRAKFRASPTAADGKIYLQNHAGEVFVVDAKKGTVLHRTVLGEQGDDLTRASVAIAGGQLFIRTNGTLFCVGR